MRHNPGSDPVGTKVRTLALPHRDADTRLQVGPLLTRLRAEVASSLGGTHVGHSLRFQRLPINVGALDLLGELVVQIGGLYEMATDNAWRNRPVEVNLLDWHAAFDAARLRSETNEAQYRLADTRLGGFIHRIESLIDPVNEDREILAECPACGQRWKFEDDGIGRSALYVEHRLGLPLVARCRCCPAVWRGQAQLIGLAKAIGVEIDPAAVRDALLAAS